MTRNFETLTRVPIFRSLSRDSIRHLDTQCLWRRARAGEWLVDYQEASRDLAFVAQGHVRVSIQSVSGKEAILRDIRDGEFFGELAAIDGQPRSAAVRCITDAIVAKMPPTVFLSIVHREADVCDQLLAALAAQVRRLANRVNEYATFDARRRLHAELLRLSRPAGDGQAIISPPPTHAELAARISTHREAVTRELSRLSRAGEMSRRTGALVIHDAEAFARRLAQAESG
jgi:CRP-like cAMP-binding protein